MGTRIELHAFAGEAAPALVAARRAIEAVDDALTIHRPSSTTMLNERLAAGQAAVIDDPLLFDALLCCAASWDDSAGLFDPTVDVARGGGCWAAMRIDRAARSVTAETPAALDFGGIGKGFALDRAVEALRAGGVTSAFLSAGESSIAVLGEHPLGGAWPVAIPHPLAADETLVTLELSDAALSISSTIGAAARSAMVRPGDGAIISTAATTVAVERTGAQSEAMSTALLVGEPVAVARLVAAAPGARYRFTFTDAAAAAMPMAGSVQ